jgi:methylenetetrahydrofolate dehydrogenase (NADP+)/methenyltetrahydrofolate cyclohydrolase
MPAELIDGKSIAESIRAEVKAKTGSFKNKHGRAPGLAFILVGENPASQVYVRNKGKACEEIGMHSVTDKFPETISEQALLARIGELNADPAIDGILVQLPLPKHINEQNVIERISPAKDVDGFHPINIGKLVIGIDTFLPCTPAGIQELLVRSHVVTSGAHIVVVGRSNIVGKPIANIMVQKNPAANAVVTICHTGARDISEFTKQADILIAAMGSPEKIRGEQLKKGVVVIDVGMNRIPDTSSKTGTRLVGDVHFDSAKAVASKITPVPGGVGPMTIAMLMQNTLKSAIFRENAHIA